MGSSVDRKAAIREFKARKPPQGVFALRCTATGQVWVDSSRNLEATRTGLWFMLRTGNHINRALQTVWNAHGEQAFQYEILDQLEEDLPPMAVSDLLKQKKIRWLAQFGAQKP